MNTAHHHSDAQSIASIGPSLGGVVIDLASHEETQARLARMAVAEHRRNTRLADMCAARELRRHCGVLTRAELQTELNNLMASMRCLGGSDMERWRDAIAEVASDLEDELHVVEAAHG